MIPHFDKVTSGAVLSRDEMREAISFMMDGHAEFENLKIFLEALSERGETPEEIIGAAQVLRARATSVQAPEGAVDCCGTGGDGAGTYNISTAVALVCAAAGVSVAKHGNRAASSKSGAADVLQALGVNLDAPIGQLEGALNELGFAFLMAPNHHGAMRHVGPARKALGKRTIFNLLGPLANPAGTRYQLIGVFDQKWCVPMAEALKELGTKAAWIVHGSDKLDEITVTGSTHIASLKDGEITEFTVSPEDFGLSVHGAGALTGGNPETNAKALFAILEGDKNAYRDIVLANAAAVLHVRGVEEDLKTAAQKAVHAIDSGAAKSILERYIDITME